MRGEWALPEERSRDELRAARVLLEADLPDQAVSRAYFAALHAASAALLVLGDPQTSEVGIVTAFARRVPDDGFDPEAGRMLRKLFEDRTDVDQALANAPRCQPRGRPIRRPAGALDRGLDRGPGRVGLEHLH